VTQSGDVRRTVEEAWDAVLGETGSVSQGNFFEQGGSSLSAVDLMARVEESLRIEFPLELLFSDRSLPEIVDECERRHRELHS
jgi:acyl carrier protein